MKIIVTGSNGFVGTHLVNLLKENSADEIHPLDRDEADITSFEQVKKYLEKVQPDQVYHLAGFASGAGKDEDLIFKVNVEGTVNILKALKEIGRPVKVMLASTAYVYGNTPECATEESLVQAKSPYDRSKAEMENRAKEFQSDELQIVIARATNHTGPGQKLGFVVPDFAKQIAEAKDDDKILVGNLEAKRDLFDVRDCVKAYKLIMEKGQPGEIYNIGTGNPIKVQEVFNKLIEISGKSISSEQDPTRMRPSDIAQNCVNNSKLKSLGWEPSFTLEQTLKETYDSFVK